VIRNTSIHAVAGAVAAIVATSAPAGAEPVIVALPAGAVGKAIRGDGQTVVGTPTIPGPQGWLAKAISWNGAAIVGVHEFGDVNSVTHAFLWTAESGLEDLGTISGSGWDYSASTAVNFDGSVVRGWASNGYATTGFVWTRSHGVNDYFEAFGVDLTGWNLGEIRGFSADGAVVMGFGVLDGEQRSWVASGLPEPSSLTVMD
jgi:probable HAF family extracellular repeat protein